MLNTKDLEYMRESVEELFPDLCNILTSTKAADGMGGVNVTWSVSSRNVPCRLDHQKTLSQDEIVAGASLRPFSGYTLSLPYSEEITTNDRVTCSGITYNVVTVNTGQSWAAVRRCTLERV
jgi:hypothetical protein